MHSAILVAYSALSSHGLQTFNIQSVSIPCEGWLPIVHLVAMVCKLLISNLSPFHARAPRRRDGDLIQSVSPRSSLDLLSTVYSRRHWRCRGFPPPFSPYTYPYIPVVVALVLGRFRLRSRLRPTLWLNFSGIDSQAWSRLL